MANKRTNYRKSGRSSYNGSRTRSYRYGYQYGSEAPALYPDEDYEERRSRRSVEEQNRSARRRGSKRRAEATGMSLGTVLLMTTMLVLICLSLFSYISLETQVTQSVKQIASYESTLASLKQANDERYNEIVASVDLDEIKTRAMTELGMTYAQENQIVVYEGETNDYVHQVQEVNK